MRKQGNTPFSRRSFLATPAAAAAAVAGAPAVLGAQSPNGTIHVAFVGVGNRGSYLLRHMLKVPGIKAVAVADLIPDRTAKAAAAIAGAGGKAATYTDYRKMIEEQKAIDAVVVAIPDYKHKDAYITVLESGKHLYAEKPLALTRRDCQEIVDAANRAKGIMQVGFQLRFDPNRHAAEQFIHGGGIGRVLFCHGMRHGHDIPHRLKWYFDRTKDGDIMMDQGIHILDLFTWAIGSHPIRAMGSGGIDLLMDDPPGRTIMDNYSVLFDYEGARVNFSHNYFDPPGFSGDQERVFGSKGAVDLKAATWQPRDKRGPQIKLEVPNAGANSTYLSLAAFIENVRLKRKPPINNVESAMQSTLVPLMGTRAIYEKRIVTWEETAG